MKAIPAPLMYALGIAATKLVSLLTLPIVARHLGPDGYGRLDIAILLIDLIGLIVGLGLVEAAQRYLAIECVGQKSSEFRQTVATTISFLSCVIFLGTAICLVLLPTIHSVLAVPLRQYELYLAVSTGAATSFLMLPLMLLRLTQQAAYYVAVVLSLAVLQAVLTLIAVKLNYGVGGLLVAGAMAHLAAVVAIGCRLVNRYGWRWHSQLNAKLLRYGAPVALSGLAAFAYNGSERWILAGTISLEELGAYSASWKIALLATFATQPFQLWWSPRRLALISEQQYEQLVRYATLGIVWLISVCAGLSVFAPWLFQLLFGPAFTYSADIVTLLLMTVSCRVAADVLNAGCFAGESTLLQMFIQLSTAAVTLLCLFLMIPQFGAIGACSALLAGALYRLCAFYLCSQRLLRIDYPYFQIIFSRRRDLAGRNRRQSLLGNGLPVSTWCSSAWAICWQLVAGVAAVHAAYWRECRRRYFK